MLQKILAKKDAALMLKQADEQGMTPLHQAAKMGYLEAVKLFIETPTGREAAYMQDKQGNTALHLAAVSNHKDTTLKIIERCPDCSDLVNSRGWSVLHSAVQSKDATAEVLDAILKSNATGHLINQKDNKGNTPLHHIAISLNSERLYELIDDPRVDKMAFNKQNRNALDLASASRVLALREVIFFFFPISSLKKEYTRTCTHTHIGTNTFSLYSLLFVCFNLDLGVSVGYFV